MRLALLLALLAGTAGAAENSPPWLVDEADSTTRRIEVGETFVEHFVFADRDGDPLTVTAEASPGEATLRTRDPRPCRESDGETKMDPGVSCRDAVFTWRPTAAQVGAHRLVLVASDGKATDRIEVRLEVEEKWESWFLPGLQLLGYFPSSRRYGAFRGPAFELAVGSWVHRTEDRGPSHGRVYLDLGLLSSARTEGKAFSYALGLDLSVERNPRRSWLLPVFGLEVGGFSQETLGTFFTATPLLGVHLWSTRNVFATVTGGYVFTGRDIDELGGWRLRAGLDAALW